MNTALVNMATQHWELHNGRWVLVTRFRSRREKLAYMIAQQHHLANTARSEGYRDGLVHGFTQGLETAQSAYTHFSNRNRNHND